jgi:membrane-associated PAP2 superfamily phosphatase
MTFPKVHFTICKRCVIALCLFAAFNILVGQFTNIDLIIEDYYFDIHTQEFLWKNTWFAKDLMHGYLKYVITDTGRLLVLVVLLDLIYPWLMFKHRTNNQSLINERIINSWWRVRLRFVAGGVMCILATI